MLGHTTIETTQLYTQVSIQKLQLTSFRDDLDEGPIHPLEPPRGNSSHSH